jgi:hypothetical protein
LHESALHMMKKVVDLAPELSTRRYDKLLKVARTVADLNRSPLMYSKHILEAAELCQYASVASLLSNQQRKRYCPFCDAEINLDDSFCSQCGKALNS